MATGRIFYIREFAKLVGCYSDTVRNYQERGLFPDKRNPANGYRIFTEEDVEDFKQMMLGNRKFLSERPKKND